MVTLFANTGAGVWTRNRFVLTHREYTEFVSRQSRLWNAFARNVALFVVVPVLRLLCREWKAGVRPARGPVLW